MVSRVGKTLIIAEKPSVGRDLASALPGDFSPSKDKTSLESDDTIVTWAVGHLVELAEPDAYGEEYKRWKLDVLPVVPERFQLQPRGTRGKKQLNAIHRLMRRDDVDRIVNACDAGREGELIFAYIYETSKVDKPVERLWINSMTKQAIREGFEHLRPGEQMASLERAARSRSEADWLIGMNATRAATIKRGWGGGVVSLGRVQTPTLAMIVRREQEIQAFVPEPYWLVHGTFEAPSRAGYAGLWFEGQETRIWNRAGDNGSLAGADRAADIVARVSGKSGTVTKVERKEQTERAPLLYDLTSLQRDANQRFGFAARRTLAAAQSLYEDKKAITYPRTNSRYLSGDMVPLLKPTAATLESVSEYARAAAYVRSLAELPLSRVVNDAKVDDHHAIIPTDIDHDVDRFSPDERRIFDLVAKRFLAVFHPPARYARTTIVSEVEGETFRTRGKVTLEAGWRGVYGVEPDDPTRQDEEGEGGELPRLQEGDTVRCVEANTEAKETKPPPRYTDATLLTAMESAGKLLEDEELAEAMKERGLGTPATRAEIIETLIRRDYVERISKDMAPTPKGMHVINMLEQHPLTSPELTGEWEKRLVDIEHGHDDRQRFMRDIADFAGRTVRELAELDPENFRPERAELGLCPRCGAETGEIIRENSRAYGCTSWKSREEPGCGFVIWKRVAGRTLTPEVARQLIEEGRTRDVLSGFKSRAGKSFRARLVLTDEGKVEFDFPERPQAAARAAADAE
jgi:DNA topoisomerase-3